MPVPDSHSPVDARIISRIGVALGIVCALAVGTLAGIAAFEPLLILLGGVAVFAVVLALQDRIWILIPIFWYLTGSFGFLPIPFSVRDLTVMLASGIFMVLLSLRVIRTRARIELLDWMVLLNCGYLTTVYVRNPVGVSAVGANMVGGRPYFEAVIAFMAFVVLSRMTLRPALARLLPLFSCIPQVAVSLLGALTHFVPSTTPLVSRIYSGVDTSEYLRQGFGSSGGELSRVTSLSGGAQAGILTLLSYFPPLSLLSPRRLFRFLCFLVVCAGFAFSGFRTGIMFTCFAFAMAAYFRNGLRNALVVVLAVVFIGGGLVTVQNAGLTLPLTAQRALSFLPGKWDRDAKDDAEDSAKWRYEMWDVVLSTDTYIHNKLLGDGFGFSNYELQIMQEEEYGGPGFVGTSRQEGSLIAGAYHSGPLSAIRYVGVVGLILYLSLLIATAVYGWKIIRRSQRTDYFPLALIVGIPAIYEPWNYVFIFGGFDSGFPNTLFLCGMLKLLSNASNEHGSEQFQSISACRTRSDNLMIRSP
jgi:hypothetical protein